MVQVIGLIKRNIFMVMLIGQNLLIIICGDEIEIIPVIILIMVIKNILDNDLVQEVIMYQVFENGVNWSGYL
jgi:hypothetical protein